MSPEKLESEALKLNPNSRAKLAEKLLQSLEELWDEENEELWAREDFVVMKKLTLAP